MGEIPHLLDHMNALKSKFNDWRRSLPAYYESISLPAQSLAIEQHEQADLSGYPYEFRLEYVTSMILLIVYLMIRFCGTCNEFI